MLVGCGIDLLRFTDEALCVFVQVCTMRKFPNPGHASEEDLFYLSLKFAYTEELNLGYKSAIRAI
jgi:hypothetical protein